MSKLTFDDYEKDVIVNRIYDANIQKFIDTLNIPEEENRQRLKKLLCFFYTTFGLLGEAGEIAEKVKKMLRDGSFEIGSNEKDLLLKEKGDVLWYIADGAQNLGSNLGEVAQLNMDKLRSRRERDVLQGSGDNR